MVIFGTRSSTPQSNLAVVWSLVTLNSVFILGKYLVLFIHIFFRHFLLTCLLPYIASIVAICSSSVHFARSLEFHDSLCFPVSLYVSEYFNYLASRCFLVMCKCGVALKICGRNNSNRVISVGVRIKTWWKCRGRDIVILRCVSWKADFPFGCCYENVQYERGHWNLNELYFARDVPEIALSLEVLRRQVHLFLLIDCLTYSWRGCIFECCLLLHPHMIMVVWHNKELWNSPASCTVQYVVIPFWLSALECHRLLFVATAPVFVSFRLYNQRSCQGTAYVVHRHVVVFCPYFFEFYMLGSCWSCFCWGQL